eukprot:TRINITY_DN10331_c0_g1_i1.p1 TRINITY_DN10331_c0_g1~~TRINITY_DN10331_c0_g1_i1.p1  ORF type:complete len:311 (-),score=93.82 TRINITY_DN10331_c0_g1_i1:23-931(-)
MALLFKKVGSAFKDLFEKDYPTEAGDKFRVDADITLKNDDVKVVVNGYKNTIGETGAKVQADATLSGIDTTVSATTDNQWELKFSKDAADGLNVAINPKVGDKGFSIAGLVEYKHEKATLNFSVNSDQPLEKQEIGDITLYGATVVQPLDNISVGVESSYNLGDGVEKVNAVALFDKDDRSVLISSKNAFKESGLQSTATLGYSQKINNALAAVDFSFNILDNEISPTLRTGVDYSLGSDSSIKTRVQFNGKSNASLGLVFDQDYHENVKVSVGADLNLNKLTGDKKIGENHKFGVSLSFFA